MSSEFLFEARIWIHEGPGSWHFVTLPGQVASSIHAAIGGKCKPGGALPVEARTGSTRWKTSIFRDNKRATYLLPLKAAVRAREQLRAGDSVEVLLLVDGID